MDDPTIAGWIIAVCLVLTFVATEIARHFRAKPMRCVPVSQRTLLMAMFGVGILAFLAFG